MKNDPLYNIVITQFQDTFKILKGNKWNFGDTLITNPFLDDGIFFNRNKTQCILIVLSKGSYQMVFGTARIILGERHQDKWIFDLKTTYTFDKDYFDLYTENTIENISRLARYTILTEGDVNQSGCQIDDNFWFVELRK